MARVRRLEISLWILALLAAPYGEGGATPTAMFTLHTILLAACLAALLPSKSSTPPAGIPRAVLLGASGWLAVSLLSSWGTPYPYASFLRVWDLAILFAVLLCASRGRWRETEKNLLWNAALLTGLMQAVLILAGAATGSTADILKRFGLLNQNHEAAYLLVISLITVSRISSLAKPLSNALRGAGAALCLAAFCLLMSRGALLGLGAGAACLLWWKWPSWMRRWRVVAAIAGTAAFLVAAGMAAHRFRGMEDPYRYERVGIWKADLRCFQSHPLLGVGPGIFRHVAHRYNFPLPGPVRYGRSFETPHSDALGLLAEMGLAGLAAGAIFFLALLGALSRERGAVEGFSPGLFAAGAALAAHGLVEDLTTRPALMITMALLLGAGLSSSRLATAPMGHEMRRLMRSPSVPAMILLWWIAVLNPYRAHLSDLAMREATTYPAMEAHFQAALRRNPFQAPTYRFPAGVFLASRLAPVLTLDLYGRFRRDLDRGIQYDETSAEVYLTLARLETRALESLFHDSATRDRALEAYRASVLRAPRDPRLRVELAGYLRSIGRAEQAVSELRRALRDEPDYMTARLLMTRFLLDLGKRGEALASWREAITTQARLTTYRADSTYAYDLTRDQPALREALERELGPS
jgi:O-antigen ligase